MARAMLASLLVCTAATAAPPPQTPASFPSHLRGNVSAVVALLERVVPGASAHFELVLAPTCPGIAAGRACFTLADGADGITISGTSAAELTGGIGVYLREYCGMTYGWVRGGGQRLFVPSPWPRIGTPVARARSVPYSHVTQVCTHSYTLVWHGWAEWERFIDWMALAGHNSIVAPTGQEEIQYKVFTQQFGLTDMEVRNWTNGPGFLTWSRGQNSHGNSIAGPLPRSFMRGQWALARQILQRYRELGIAGHQPAFAGYAPWALAVRHDDTRKTPRTPYPCTRGKQGAVDTAWVDGRDELFTRVADAWMAQIIADFGTDHVWQMDGFFSGGTGWGMVEGPEKEAVACEWSTPSNGTYLAGCAQGPDPPRHHRNFANAPAAAAAAGPGQPRSPRAACTPHFASLEAAQAACVSTAWRDCAGITLQLGVYQLRAGDTFIPQPPGKEVPSTSYRITNLQACKGRPPPPPPGPVPAIDPVWLARALGAYGAVERADGPEARWLLQGWMLLIRGQGFGPSKSAIRGPLALSRLRAYAAAAPPGNFILMDMDRTGAGQWQKWKGEWGLPFIWTSLHVFGGNDGIKGNLTEINAIPWQAPPLAPAPPTYNPQTQAVGVGYVSAAHPAAFSGIHFRPRVLCFACYSDCRCCAASLSWRRLCCRRRKAWTRTRPTTSSCRRVPSRMPPKPTSPTGWYAGRTGATGCSAGSLDSRESRQLPPIITWAPRGQRSAAPATHTTGRCTTPPPWEPWSPAPARRVGPASPRTSARPPRACAVSGAHGSHCSPPHRRSRQPTPTHPRPRRLGRTRRPTSTTSWTSGGRCWRS
jgi:hypothetical protein